MDDNAIIPEKRRKLKVSHILIVLLLIAIGAFVLYRWRLRSKLQARIDAIRAAGYPVTCAELDDWYSIPKDAKNAAYTIIDAFSYYQDANEAERKLLPVVEEAELPGRTESLPADTMRVITRYMADNKEALALLHESAAIEYCRYPLDLSPGIGVLAPHFTDIRKGALRLKLESIMHGENQQRADAVDSVISIFGLARSLDSEPSVVAQFVRGACLEMGTTALEWIVNRVELTEEQLAKIIDVIREAERSSDMSCGVAGCRAAELNVFRSPESVEVNLQIVGDKWPHPIVLKIHNALGLLDKSAIIYLDLMADLMEITELPEHERQEAVGFLKDKLEKTPKVHALVRLLTPKFADPIIRSDLTRTAQLRTAQVGLAIERFRLAAGKLPEKIADLVPAYLDNVPKDPFDGEDLRYKPLGPSARSPGGLAGKLERGFVVYSIGEDGSDDGGKEQPPRSKRKGDSNWDITFIVE